VRAEEASGTIASVGSTTTLTLADEAIATYTTDRFKPGTATQDNKYILEVLDGRYIGLVAYIKSNAGNTFTIDEVSLPTDGLLVGSKYAIRKDWTIQTLFGAASATSPLASGASTGSADVINIWSQKAQSYNSFYIRLSGGVYSWRDAIGNEAQHTRIPYGQGVQLVKRSAGNGTLTLTGELRSSRLRRDLLAGKTALVANLSPSPTTLGEMDISIARGNSTAASVVKIWSTAGSGSWVPYYRKVSDGKFYNALGALSETQVIGAGKVVQVVNKSVDQIGATALTINTRQP
jgi:hypothetical protein